MPTTSDGVQITYTRTVVIPESALAPGVTPTSLNTLLEAGASLQAILTKNNFFNSAIALECDETASASAGTISSTFTPDV